MPDEFIDGEMPDSPPMSEPEAREILDSYLDLFISRMTESDLLVLRERIAAKHVGSPEQTSALEMIDGELALRRNRLT